MAYRVEKDPEEWIAEQQEVFMQRDEKCYPFSPKHVLEAIAQIGVADTLLLASYVEAADTLGDSELFRTSDANLGQFVRKIVKTYWKDAAFNDAKTAYYSSDRGNYE